MPNDPGAPLKVLVLGDIVGDPGVKILQKHLPRLRHFMKLDVVIANGENASGGSGMNPGAFKKIKAAGVDMVTMGDHIYKKQEIISVLESDETICRPANFPKASPGKCFAHMQLPNETRIVVISLLGRTFMRPVDCPFEAVDRLLSQFQECNPIFIVDVHAEATADKYMLGNYLAGRVSAVFGTHTHVPTADEQILGDFTAFQCDLGMTGPYKGVLGRSIEPVIDASIRFVHRSFEVATEDCRISGALVEICPNTKRALSVQRVHLKEHDLDKLPA